THEFQRMGALNGQVLDADGKTVLLDIYKSFGVNRQKLQMGLNSPDTELRVKCGEALDMQEEALGSVTSSGSRAMCGKNFWNKLIVHKSVKETYLNT
ncbi:major capsid protein, partial [Salmonella enterica subsp. enterica serovar 1,4,[5],12:i:-]|nr:major capsid protein [Salmonella enterica subsp. enterica serovar 1,4,[5],12:i:-]